MRKMNIIEKALDLDKIKRRTKMRTKIVTLTRENLDNFYKRNCLSKRTLNLVLEFNNYSSISGVFVSGKITYKRGCNVYNALVAAGYKDEEIGQHNFSAIPLAKTQSKLQHYKLFVIDMRLSKIRK